MRQFLSINGGEHSVSLAKASAGYRLRVDGGPARAVQMTPPAGGPALITFDGRTEEALIAVDGDRVHVHLAGSTYEIGYTDPASHFAGDGGQSADDVVLAPMPGTVVAVHVAAGASVEPGEPLLVIESMKLETTIKAWRKGTVETVHVAKGDSFERQAPLVTLAAGAGGV